MTHWNLFNELERVGVEGVDFSTVEEFELRVITAVSDIGFGKGSECRGEDTLGPTERLEERR